MTGNGCIKAAIAVWSLILAGCASNPERLRIHKTGSTSAERTLAHDNCKIASIKEIPQTQAVVTSPSYSSPGTTQCSTNYGVTTCNQVGALNVPSSTSSYDVNAVLRKRFIIRCLNSKGFSVIPISRVCRTGEEKTGLERDRVNQRSADQMTCYSNSDATL